MHNLFIFKLSGSPGNPLTPVRRIHTIYILINTALQNLLHMTNDEHCKARSDCADLLADWDQC